MFQQNFSDKVGGGLICRPRGGQEFRPRLSIPALLPTVTKLPEKDGSSQSLSVPVENEDGHSVTTRGWSERWQGDPG